ncbi:RNA polymerase sigma factor [Stieleria maiorica]|uniref:RNA polymerase sigma factor n=1 Tax=Stieleria maiorica TaxID=2795974 RepID=A0A5B9MP00_9BACT|nr:sigma-70 family RNA polymerase sigma factor [Stieleria maiorica]QEG01781.1 RNA polymerase sigma factor [Stieleria maiorica]
MDNDHTTLAVQHYLEELAQMEGDAAVAPVVGELIARSVARLQLLCGSLLFRSYPRLLSPPLNLQTEELLSAVVDRLLRAIREVRPKTVRQFFALANKHIRWELNDLARQLDGPSAALELQEGLVASPEPSGSQLSGNARRILQAIEELPEAERETFSLVRVQGMSHVEVAELVGVSTKTIQRRLNRSLMLLSAKLSDLDPMASTPNGV